MLPQADEKLLARKVYLDLANLSFQKVMHCLLMEWGYRVLDKPEPGGVALIQEGRPIPIEAGPIIRLAPSRNIVPGRICIPVSLEELWTQLESLFHQAPRRHIRRAVSLPANVMFRGKSVATTVVSLSDWGCRFHFNRELSQGEQIEVEMRVAKVSIAVKGRVANCMFRGEEARRDQTEVGMIFEGVSAELRKFFRRNLVTEYLAKISEKITTDEFQEGVKYFNLSPQLLESLGCLATHRRGFLPR